MPQVRYKNHTENIASCPCYDCEKLRVKSKDNYLLQAQYGGIVSSSMWSPNFFEGEEFIQKAAQYSSGHIKIQPMPVRVTCSTCHKSMPINEPHTNCEREAFLCEICGHTDWVDLRRDHYVKGYTLDICATCKGHLTTILSPVNPPVSLGRKSNMPTGLKYTLYVWGAFGFVKVASAMMYWIFT